MDIITELPALQTAIGAHYAGGRGHLPADTQAHLERAFGYASPVQRVAEYGEALYAARPHLNDADRTLVGQIAYYCGLQGFSLFGFGEGPDGRGGRMFQAMRKDLGEPAAAQPPENDPEPKGGMVPAAPEAETPEGDAE